MEFDKEGRIIIPGGVKEDIERDSNSIILERAQISLKNPAVAQLRIKLGENLKKRMNEDMLIGEIYYFCKQFIERSYRFNEVEAKINLIGSSIVIETRSSFQMYGLLNAVVEEMYELYVKNKGMSISRKGSFGA